MFVVSMFEVSSIIEQRVELATNLGGNETADGSTNDGDGESDQKGTKLVPALLSQIATIISQAEDFLTLLNVSHAVSVASGECENSAEDSTNDSGQAVQVLHTAGVVDPSLLLNPSVKVKEAEG